MPKKRKREQRCPEELTEEDYKHLNEESDDEEIEDDEELRDTW